MLKKVISFFVSNKAL